jgi:hypothetical protein
LLTIAAAQQQALLAAAQQGDEAAQLQLQQQQQQLVPDPEVAEGDDALFGRVEGEALRIAAMSVRRVTEELSDAEDELFVHNTGNMRDMCTLSVLLLEGGAYATTAYTHATNMLYTCYTGIKRDVCRLQICCSCSHCYD